MSLSLLPTAVMLLSGLALSAYAYGVEKKAERAAALGTFYQASCDIGPFSCTKVFTSEFGALSAVVGLPKVSNAAVGILFYLFEMLCLAGSGLGGRGPLLLLLLSTAAGAVASVGLAFILFGLMRDFCLVCASTYVVNFIAFGLTYHRYKQSAKRSSPMNKNGKKKA